MQKSRNISEAVQNANKAATELITHVMSAEAAQTLVKDATVAVEIVQAAVSLLNAIAKLTRG